MQENGAEHLVACTGCQGCMPCMVKINIPLLFELYNRTESEGIEAVRAEYESQEKRADDCINCYRCEKTVSAAPRDRHSDAGYCRNLRRIEKPASVQFKEKF